MADAHRRLAYSQRKERLAAKTVDELQEKKTRLESLRAKDKQTAAAMGRALTESKRDVKKLSITLQKHRIKQKEEVRQASAVLEDTKTSLEVAKKVSYCLFLFTFCVSFFSRPLAPKGRHHKMLLERPPNRR